MRNKQHLMHNFYHIMFIILHKLLFSAECISFALHAIVDGFLQCIMAFKFEFWKSESEWCDIPPSMVTHTRNLCSAINPYKVHTQQWTHTHREHTPGAVGSQCCGTRGAVGGLVLAQGHLSRGIEGEERALDIHSPHLQFLPDLRLELTTFGLRVRLSNH